MLHCISRFSRYSKLTALVLGLWVVALMALALHPAMTASVGLSPDQHFIKMMNSYLPDHCTSAHWTATLRLYAKDDPKRVVTTNNCEGWYQAPDHFRVVDSSHFFVINGTDSWTYQNRTNSTIHTRVNPRSTFVGEFRPDAYRYLHYNAADVISANEVPGQYNGRPTNVLDMYFRGKKTGAINTGPVHMAVYLAPTTREPIAKTVEEWDPDGKVVVATLSWQCDYNVPIDPNVFVFNPPAGAH